MPPDADRRRHGRREDRAEMSLGASRASISNLSIDGAFVSILAGLQPEDRFSFELMLDDGHESVRGRAHVVWVDPGIGAGVRFDLSDPERERLAAYLERLDGPSPEAEAPPGEPPRQSRRTVALGPDTPGAPTKVWFRYLPPDSDSE